MSASSGVRAPAPGGPAGDLLAGLFDPPVEAAAAPPQAHLADLAAGERTLVAKAVESRQREFAQGRLLARSLLARLGVAGSPLLRDDDRVPRWPAGSVGSISHTQGLCGVAVARTDEVEAVGLDLELATPLRPELRARVCTPAERGWLEGLAAAEAGRYGKAFFSVKECVYKACFPRLRERWGFQDLEVELDLPTGGFVAVPREGGLAGQRLAGRIAARGRWWLSALTLRTAQPRGSPLRP